MNSSLINFLNVLTLSHLLEWQILPVRGKGEGTS